MKVGLYHSAIQMKLKGTLILSRESFFPKKKLIKAGGRCQSQTFFFFRFRDEKRVSDILRIEKYRITKLL